MLLSSLSAPGGHLTIICRCGIGVIMSHHSNTPCLCLLRVDSPVYYLWTGFCIGGLGHETQCNVLELSAVAVTYTFRCEITPISACSRGMGTWVDLAGIERFASVQARGMCNIRRVSCTLENLEILK
jgi:hypothetical protein